MDYPQQNKWMIDALGITFLPTTPEGVARAQMSVDERTCQPFGMLCGGASLALAEILAGAASIELLDKNHLAYGMTVSGNHVLAVPCGETVTAYATLQHKGKTTHVWNVDIKTNDGTLVSTIRVTNYVAKINNDRTE